jgi:hypothetical protein
MATLLAKRNNQIPVATDDDHFETMAADPAIREIPQGSSWDNMYSQPSFNQQIAPSFGNTQNINQSTSNTPVLTGAAPTNAASGAEILVANTNKDWMNRKWRPAMGWMYMAVCITDFILFPILWAIVQFWETQAANDAFRQWQPLTLQGAGLFHIAMGAVLGIAAYGRTKEKIENKD